MQKLFSVSEITGYLKMLLDNDEILSQVLVEGEISNFTRHGSGHLYFTMKDNQSRLRCVMFRTRAAGLQFRPEAGMSVVALGNISVYERDGQYQLYVNSLRPAGQGQLYLAFTELKDKLEREGLFAPERKRPLPFLPRTVGVATSPTGAALQDILSVIRRRYPRANILVAPTVVQGAEAPASIVRSLGLLGQVADVDVVIVGRGGGSIEELWGFNDEGVARAIAACPKPVISAVGHETDFTIADFVADFRAPTPSAAAEAAVPVLAELEMTLLATQNRLYSAMENGNLRRGQGLSRAATRLERQHPRHRLGAAAQTLDGLSDRLERTMALELSNKREQVANLGIALEAMNPLAVLGRGYSLTFNADGGIVRAPQDVTVGESLQTVLAQGRIHSQVQSTEDSSRE